MAGWERHSAGNVRELVDGGGRVEDDVMTVAGSFDV